jgi:amino-acid N-acetyltransferase
MTYSVVRGQENHLREVLSLLEEVDLPTEGVEEFFRDFLVISDGLEIAGCIGLEVYGSVALLRSFAITPSLQKKGYGAALLNAALEDAAKRGISEVYLLTDTAEKYFSFHGFETADRSSAPEAISRTREFSELCPSGSAFMLKRLP